MIQVGPTTCKHSIFIRRSRETGVQKRSVDLSDNDEEITSQGM